MTTKPDELNIPKDADYAIRNQTAEESQKQEDSPDIEEYRVQMTFTDDQKECLTTDFFAEFDAIDAERKDLRLPEKWKEADAQWDGTLAPNDRLLFNCHVHQSKVKGMAIVRAMSKAYLSSGQIADVSPRPGMAQTNTGYDICQKQSDFLDFAYTEEIKPADELKKAWTTAYKKYVGIIKQEWAYRIEKRKRYETYEGKNVQVPVGGQVKIENDGLEAFMQAYPDAKDRYPGLLKKLVEEKQVKIVVEYKDVVNNNVKFTNIKIENFYVRNGCNGWEGLRTEHCIAEEQEYTYWELMKKQKDGAFENVEALWAGDSQAKDNNESTPDADYKNKSYKVLEGTYYWKLKDDDEDEVKIKCWFGRDKKVFLGAILFPYYAIDIDYVPFYLRLNEYGFYGNCLSVMDDLKDSNIAQDALLSLFLHGSYARSILTPITKEGSLIEELFLEKDWVEGMPLSLPDDTQDVSKELSFVQWPQMNGGEMLNAIGFAQRTDGNVTGISDAAATGANDPTDPNAPAHKTIALMQASGINIEDYIETTLPSFNQLCTNTFQLYYQMSNEDRKYRVRRKSEGVVGDDPFATITRDELIAKTSVESRAAGFVFEKAQARQDATLGLQAVLTNPYLNRIPMVQYKAAVVYLETLGPRWRTFAESEIPTPDELDKQLTQVAFKAVSDFMSQAGAQQGVTGVPAQANAKDIKNTIQASQTAAYNPAMAAAKGKADQEFVHPNGGGLQ